MIKQVKEDASKMKNNRKEDDLKVLINLQRKQLNHEKAIETELELINLKIKHVNESYLHNKNHLTNPSIQGDEKESIKYV